MEISQVMEAKGKFAKLYRKRKNFLGVGVGKVEHIYTIRAYVKTFDCSFVDELKNKGFMFEGLPVKIHVIGEIKAI